MNEAIVISSSGLSPSNAKKGFPNLARSSKRIDGKDVFEPKVIKVISDICEKELIDAGIKVHRHWWVLSSNTEVPSEAMGELSRWTFKRAWYYWVAKGPGLPVEVAERLHETHGTVVRVDGHCGCPNPREWGKGFGIGSYHVDSPNGLRALAEALLSVYDESKDKERR